MEITNYLWSDNLLDFKTLIKRMWVDYYMLEYDRIIGGPSSELKKKKIDSEQVLWRKVKRDVKLILKLRF